MTYWYRLGAVDREGEFFSPIVSVETPTMKTTLYQNYPNPFNPTTTISFYLPGREHVVLVIYDVQGRRVRTLFDKNADFGRHDITWDGKDDRGVPVSSGVYFYRLVVGKTQLTKKLTILK